MVTINLGWYSWDLLIKEGKFRALENLEDSRSYCFKNIYTDKRVDGFIYSKCSEDGLFYDYGVRLGY